MRFITLLLSICSFSSYCQSKQDNTTTSTNNNLEIFNNLPRTTLNDSIVDAHDGRVVKFKNTYYWYGTSYGNTNGFTTANTYHCYSSEDLKSWKKEGALLSNQPEGVYYRPHVIYNEKTEKFVLWYNWYPQLWDGQFGVAVSDNPQGPFLIVNDNVQMSRSAVGLGDFGLFVDDDKTAYISYNTIKNHQVSIEQLSDDYLKSTMKNGGVIAEHMEAGSQFKREGKYYLLTDYTCCFCNYGSGARVYISDKPLSGYVFTGNINRYPGNYLSVLNDGQKTGTRYATLTKTDSEFPALEIQIPPDIPVQSLQVYLFTGNRPENCGDVTNPRVHPPIETPNFDIAYWDFDHWEPIELINSTHSSNALSQTVDFIFNPIHATRFKIITSEKYGYNELYLNEIEYNSEKSVDGAYVTGHGYKQPPIIPAQQTYVMQLATNSGPEYIWMGDLWGSASDNIKGHDYQYWSAPLKFNSDGTINPLKWTEWWNLSKPE